MKILQGIIVPLITPLKEDEAIDEEGLRKLVEHLIAEGVHGIFTCSTTGEFQYLSSGERLQVTGHVIKYVNKKLPVYAGISGYTLEETLSNIKDVAELSPDAFVIAPLLYHSNRKLPQHIQKVVKTSRIPFVLYNNDELIKPPLRRENIRTGILKRISKLDEVIGMKDSSGDMKRFRNYIRAVRKRRDFRILQGDERQLAEGLCQGAGGAVPSLANIFPGLCVRLYNNFSSEKKECFEIQKQVIEIGNRIYLDRRKIRGGLKEALRINGIIKSSRVKDPSQALTEEELSDLKAYLCRLSTNS